MTVTDILGLFCSDKQKKLEMIREQLNAQMQQRKDDEDERIRRAVEESEARRRAEDSKKEAWTRKMQDEITKHRTEQVHIQFRFFFSSKTPRFGNF